MNNIELIQSLINEANNLPNRDTKKLDALLRRAEMIIRNVFGNSESGKKYLEDLKNIHFSPIVVTTLTRDSEYGESWELGKSKILNLFNTMLEELKLFNSSSKSNNSQKANAKISKRVFIVHGHNNEMKQTVARILEKLGLEPIILHEMPNQGKTIIEKFINFSDVSFAIVLLSPDDIAYSKNESLQNAKSRARQNVIFELGFFIGKLRKEGVIVLYPEEENFEMPSDYSGILYIPYDDNSKKWQLELVKELQFRGYNVDANKLI